MSGDNLGHSINGLTLSLRAEVIKKKKEFDQSKTQKDSTSHKPNKPLFTKNKRSKSDNKNKSKSKHKQSESNPETEELMNKSRFCLEKKSQFYEKMNKMENFNSAIKHSESYLVDFESKITDSKLDDSHLNTADESVNTSRISNSLEYKKLASMTVKAPEISEDIIKPFNVNDYQHLHYQEAVGREIRERGVGYFAFSTDEATRRQQMEDIEMIHADTENNIAKRQRMLETKDRTRRGHLAQGKDPMSLLENAINGENTMNSEVEPSELEPDAKENTTTAVERDAILKRKELDRQKEQVFKLIDSIRESTRKHSREWDRDKFSEVVGLSRFQEERGDGRNPDFAPPDFYTAKKQRYFDY